MSTTRGTRRAARWLLLVALMAALAGPAAARKKDKREYSPARLPSWVKEAVERAPEKSPHEVVWLHEEKIVAPHVAGGLRVSYRVAGKAFNASGLEVLGDWSVYYIEGDRFDKLEVWTVQPGGHVRRADEDEDVVDRPAIGDARMFNDSRAKLAEASGVTIGSVVAFEYEKLETLDVGADSLVFGSSSRPTLFTRFELQAPEGWKWEVVVKRGDTLEVQRSEQGAVVTAENLEPLKKESGRPAANRLLPVAWAYWRSPDGERGFETWDQVGLWHRELGEEVMDEPGEAATLSASFKPDDDDDLVPALGRAFEFAARDVRYVAIDIGLGMGAGYKPAPPGTVCDKRYGDCKDKAYLLRALARPWGLKTYPVAVRTSGRGPLVEEVPTPAQFNHCIAAIELPEGVGSSLWSAREVEGIGRVVFLDATARENSPWALRSDVQGTTALLMHPGGGKLVELPVQPPQSGSTTRSLDVRVDEQGDVIDATLVETWTGTSASWVRRYYAGSTDEQHRRKALEDLNERVPGATMTDYAIEGLDDIHVDVTETTKMEGGRLGKRVGDLIILEPGKAGYGLLGGTLKKPPREYPYRLGLPREERLQITIRAPEGWVPEETPQGLSIETDHFRVETAWSTTDGAITYDRTARILEQEVSPEDYAAFREQFNRARGEDRRAIVLVPQ